jgi:septal ring factor EnvC (AmiA/AmiB activator)
MPLFDYSFNIDIITLLVIIGLSVLFGLAIRSRQLAKKNRKIAKLETETIQANAEVLEVQKEFCELEARVKDLTIPVISMKKTTKEEEKQNEKPPDHKNRPTRTA